MIFIFIVFFSAFRISGIHAEANKCYQCASENLKEDWAATGLPYYPTNLQFYADCHSPTIAATKLTDVCASSCFELLLPIKSTYAILRGCHADFTWPEFVVNGNDSHSCEYNKIEDYGSQGVTLFGTEETAKTAYAAMGFCKKATSDESTIPCNSKITKAAILEEGIDSCKTGSSTKCKKCDYYDGDGGCLSSTGNECQGAYCTKVQGVLNNHIYTSRGCSAFNPFTKDTCSWTAQSFNLTTGATQIGLPFKATQCFCKGELCNSAPPIYSTLIATCFLAAIFRIL
ncbi:unnamed protein product [Caenorhabditis angaria]|uniref:Uncharacterized protein n=1 Tax=Caenorhabditis angaria TaxID=860376 RepID=A0A9P1MWY7_9PELO|nr:unnamed protein product [Caenorhabditis angaria]